MYYSILNISLLGEEYEAHFNAMENVTLIQLTKFKIYKVQLSVEEYNARKQKLYPYYIYIYIICKESSDNFKDAKFF